MPFLIEPETAHFPLCNANPWALFALLGYFLIDCFVLFVCFVFYLRIFGIRHAGGMASVRGNKPVREVIYSYI